MATDVSSVTKHFPSAENGFTTTLSGSISSGAATVGLNSVAGYTNGETVVFVVDPTDAAKKQTFTGVIDTGGVQVTGVVWTAGTNQAHSAGATVVDYATATHISMMTKGLLVEHAQTGLHALTSNATLTSSKVITGLNDTNGNEIMKVTPTGSAVNEITVANAATGNGPVISATGGDTNIDLVLTPKGTGTIKTSPVDKIDWTALPLGSAVQTVYTNYTAAATGTTTIPLDDTIPQITEGDQYMTQTITPLSATNILVIESIAFVQCSLQSYIIAALFQDATANGLAAGMGVISSNGYYEQVNLRHVMIAGTTSATTFRVRMGPTAGTMTFNGATTRLFGATTKSTITVTEYKV